VQRRTPLSDAARVVVVTRAHKLWVMPGDAVLPAIVGLAALPLYASAMPCSLRCTRRRVARRISPGGGAMPADGACRLRGCRTSAVEPGRRHRATRSERCGRLRTGAGWCGRAAPDQCMRRAGEGGGLPGAERLVR